jgi:ABC-type polysaccharide/polyol phosphate export permease
MLEPARQILRSRGLLWTLTVRELKARYRGSVLGFLWSLVHPLLLLSVYTFVFGVVFESRVPGLEPYALFLVSGLFPWVWFQGAVLEGTVALTAHAALLRKAAFPAAVLPGVAVLTHLLHFALAVPILAAALLTGRLLGFPVGGTAGLLLPVLVGLQLPFLTGAALGLSALHAHFKDVRDLVGHVLTLAFFLTPILYALEAIPYAAVRAAVRANPLTPFTLAYQEVLFRGTVPAPELWLQMAGVSLVGWVIGAWLFDRLAETLVEVV